MTCKCRAEFCYICGGVWDPAEGCPNACKEEEMIQHQREQEERMLEN